MKQTRVRTLALLLALAALLGGALALLTRHNRQEEAAASAAAEGDIPLSHFATDTLSQIVLETGGETLTLTPSEAGWTLAEDPAYHLDETACNSMQTALADLNAKRQLTAAAGEDYGLDAPQAVVTVTADGAAQTFRFGAENPVTGDVYLQKDGDEAVYTVAASKLSPFLTSKAELFGAFCPAGFTRSEIEAVRYTLSGGETVSLRAMSEPAESASSAAESEADSTEYQTVWRLADEPEAALDESKVDGILSALSSYVSAQDTGAAPAAQEAETPLLTAEVTTAEGTVTLTYASGTDGYCLRVEGDSSIYTVDASTVAALQYSAEALKAS